MALSQPTKRPALVNALALGALLFVLGLPGLPLGEMGPYTMRVATQTMLYMILALGLNIVPGFTGLLDLGYVGFYGIGAYTAGLLTIHYDLSFWVILPLAALNGALWGILLGAPTLRLTGDYFAIVTFGFSELVVLIIRNEIWLTRGP
ncbi:MAG: high-affinity branched-chain amino acid ABC transporter permease LivM, partial [bacterium]